MTKTFAEEISSGLKDTPKHLPSKYFYDKIGDALFVNIMNCDEYYLTRSEFEIFKDQTDLLIDVCEMDKENFDIYELGAGDGTKTIELLKKIKVNDFSFSPIDISENALKGLVDRLHKELPNIKVSSQQGEYFGVLETLKSSRRKIILFLGSNIGNLSDNQAHGFIEKLSESLNKEDILILGVDLRKSKDIVLPAYNDKSGYTAAFNLNLLTRINNELDGDFDLNNFKHSPSYEEEEGLARSFLQSTIDHKVYLHALALTIEFKKDEKILMEISRKYDDNIISEIIEGTGLKVKKILRDSKGYFADYVFVKSL